VTIANGQITNTGDVPTYVCVEVVVTWQKTEKGQTIISATAPSYTVTTNGWTLGSDGFCYYLTPLTVDGLVAAPAVSPITGESDGYTLTTEILVSAIQATPEAVQNWSGGRYTIDGNGKLIANTG
jgi:hypothetical protein